MSAMDFIAAGLNRAAIRVLDDGRVHDFSAPAGEAALCAADSVSWRVFKNPIALFTGGVAAVILELAEPRVRTGVWEFSDFRRDPVGRMRRTGMAAMVTVYAARVRAEAMIAGIGLMHARVQGMTPDGTSFRALEPELMNWVQATASFGFVEAYHAYAAPLGEAAFDRFYAEAAIPAALYGASGAPVSRAGQRDLFTVMQPRLERSDIIREFLGLVERAPLLPTPLRGFQRGLVRAAVALVPEVLRNSLGLGREYDLGPFERRLICLAGAAGERLVLANAPPAQSCRRLGLGAGYLYRSGNDGDRNGRTARRHR